MFEAEVLDKLARIESSIEFFMDNYEYEAQGLFLPSMSERLASARMTKAFTEVHRKKRPLVSVIVPVSRAISIVDVSVKSIMMQSYDNLEIILVTENHDDELKNWVNKQQDRRLKLIVNRDHVYPHGQYSKWAQAGGRSRNIGLRFASGDFLTYLDDDDFMLDDKIMNCLSVAQSGQFEIVGHKQGKRSNFDIVEFRSNKINKTRKFSSGSVDSSGLGTNNIFLHKWFKNVLWPSYNYKNLRGIDKAYLRMLLDLEPKLSIIDKVLVLRS